MMQASSYTTLVFLIFVQCLGSQSQQISILYTLKPGDRLNLSSQLVSANGIFSLAFTVMGDPDTAYLGLGHTKNTYASLWIGNREHPASRSRDPFLTVDITGKLFIAHGTNGGDPIELYAGEASKKNNVSVTLLDTGNLVVKEMSSSNGEVILWQSFDHPTDTLLPGMKLGVNHRTGTNRVLTSWFGPLDPAPGAFTLEWDPSVGRLLVRRRGIVYWTSGKLKDYYVERGGLRVKEFDNILPKPDPANLNYNFSVVTSGDEEYFTYSLIDVPVFTPDNRKISGLTMDYEGYVYDKDRPTIAKAGFCYGYDETHTNPGCELREQPKCRNDGQMFDITSGDFRHVNGTPAPSVYDSNSSLSISDCREKCWNDCECVGYTSGNVSGCVYWRGTNLEFVRTLPPAGSYDNTFVLVSTSSRQGKKGHVKIIPVAVSITVVLFILGTIVALFAMRKITKGRRKEDQLPDLLTLDGYTETYGLESGGANNHHDLRMFTYASIQSATNNFSSNFKLGQGGFGPVYKGKTSEGQDIAVKLLSRQSGQGLLEFKTELILISKLQHVNLVKLLGFCNHGDEKMIIYDYMPNKSLDFFLFRPSNREQLNWQQRFNIIEGIAQGLLYLHKYSRLKIIHRDLKPSNILLDKDMNPKISDFGLARIFKQNVSEANTIRRAGTYGYMAPEYAMQGIFSVKSDVYSFGVIVPEIISGKKNNSFHQIEGPLDLVEHAWELWNKDCALEIMDPTLRASCIADQVQRCIHVGLLCVENHAVDRPTIEDVISMLKNETTSVSMPKNPAFITRNSIFDEVEKSRSEKLLTLSSANEFTITQLEAR
ncbi:G-type lectin S-receptor-like serine/threonine-protein kinase [Sesamum angolense]|uniref:Receptor-like serine/threonine-protein kinase n=1 Tax=Sesamum angolense TaxID=2727404 RepID=A0AAE1W9I7_9LAMI|nr:G-type lectin S-receptor-like serine/threonine-protein kinase [Sesamum angolense]